MADPGSGLTVVSLEDGELNMFGSCTRIRTTQWESYPEIEDEPMVLHAGDCIKEKLHTGLAELAALAGVAAARVTERAALEPYICALGGVASLMTGGGTGYMYMVSGRQCQLRYRWQEQRQAGCPGLPALQQPWCLT